MYRVSPLTYLAAAMMAAGIANAPVECSDIEVLSVTPPTGKTCEEYLSAYQSYAGGTIINPNSADKCRFCPLQNTNTYLDSVGAEYSQRWRNATLMLVYIAFNVVGIFALYWFFRMPRGRTTEGKRRKR